KRREGRRKTLVAGQAEYPVRREAEDQHEGERHHETCRASGKSRAALPYDLVESVQVPNSHDRVGEDVREVDAENREIEDRDEQRGLRGAQIHRGDPESEY